MPAAIGYVAGWLGIWTGSAVVAQIAYYAIYIGVMVGLSKLFAPKIPKLKEGLAGKSTMKRTAVDYRKIVYGQANVSGPVFYNNLTGDEREYLWYGIALADGPIEDVVSVWLDKSEIPQAEIAWTAGIDGASGAGTGNVSTTEWVDGPSGAQAVSIRYALGHPDQVAMTHLTDNFADLGSSHRLRGIAYVVVRLLYDENTQEIWRGGAPNNISALIKGRKIYDPRRDSTQVIASDTGTVADLLLLQTGDQLGLQSDVDSAIQLTSYAVTYGTGSHRTDTSSTWEWSDNPALCVADYLVNYMNVDADSGIDWPSVADAADHCKTLVAIPPSASPQTSFEKRFTCNGVISLGASHKDNLHSLLSSFDGKLSYVEGKWRVRSSVWDASSVSFDDDDLSGPVEVRGSAPKAERFNTIRGVFVDPDRNYEPVEFPLIYSSLYKTRDNSVVITRDLELSMTNTNTMAQRIGFRMIEQADNQIVAKIKTNARGAKASVGDVVSLTLSKLGWSAKTFRVVEWQRNDNGTFDITMREDESASYDDPLIGAYTTGNSAYTTVPGYVVPPPVNLSASTVPYGVKLSWLNPGVREWDFIDVYASPTNAWSGASKVASVRTDTYTHSVGSGSVRYFWIRARRNTGDVSTRVPNSDTSTVSGTSGSGSDSVLVLGAVLSDILITSNDAEVSYKLASTGEEQSYEGDGGTHADIGNWLLAGAAGDYDCRLTVNSGTVPACDRSPGVGVWLDMGTSTTWTLTDTVEGGGTVSNNCTIEIRDTTVSPMSTIASATVTMAVEKTAPAVTLSGTTSSPNLAECITVDPTNAEAGWKFLSTGGVQRLTTAGWVSFGAGVEWVDGTPPSTYYIRGTKYSDNDPDTGTLGTWQSLSGDVSWTWTDTTAGVSPEVGVLKVEIATDTSPQGTNIVATGYYKGSAWKESSL